MKDKEYPFFNSTFLHTPNVFKVDIEVEFSYQYVGALMR